MTIRPAMRVRPSLCTLLLLAACTGGGGGGGSVTFAPIAQWGTFRHDGGNTALGSGTIDDNRGVILSFPLGEDDSGSSYHAAPAIGSDGEIYIGTSMGLRALRKEGSELVEQWHFEFCNLDDGSIPCTDPSERCIEVGPIESTPAVTAGDDLLVVSTNGWLFVVHDDGRSFTCRLALQPSSGIAPSSRSSPQTLIDGRDLSINSAFTGTSDGGIQAFNGDGTTRWRFSPALEQPVELTSTPAIGVNLYFVAPDGYLYAVDFAGRFRWRASVGTHASADLAPSPSVNIAVYAVTADGGVAAYNPDGTFKWRFRADTGRPILGSPAIVLQSVEDQDPNDPDNPASTITVFEPIVYVVDDQGMLFGVRDRDGSVLLQDRCSGATTDQGCVNDADCPPNEICQRLCSLSNAQCLGDEDCPPLDGVDQTCNGFEAQVALAPEGTVRSSPIISIDLFAVVGTEDGRVCARGIDNTTPSNEAPPTTPSPTAGTPTPTPVVGAFSDGCLQVAPAGMPITSSPVLDRDGRVYVVAGGVLYAIE